MSKLPEPREKKRKTEWNTQRGAENRPFDVNAGAIVNNWRTKAKSGSFTDIGIFFRALR
jgi:hypothetical protein